MAAMLTCRTGVRCRFPSSLTEDPSSGGSISQWLSWPTTAEGYTWSNDNLAEIEKGWIIKADTIERAGCENRPRPAS